MHLDVYKLALSLGYLMGSRPTEDLALECLAGGPARLDGERVVDGWEC